MASKRAPAAIAIAIEDGAWLKRLPRARAIVRKAARLALASAPAAGGAGLSVALTSDRKMAALNRDFRGKNKPTNVLAFPSGGADAGGHIGDIALAYATIMREARQQGKKPADHLSHLAVHGTLHLLGHDHVTPAQARRMERLERAILASMGIADPYLAPQAAAPRRRRGL